MKRRTDPAYEPSASYTCSMNPPANTKAIPLTPYRLAVLAAWLLCAGPALGGLKPFPLSANQRGTVTCLDYPAVNYDIYLPPAYSPDGPPLPILYTLNPSGGGMVSNFKVVCSNLNIIAVGVKSSKNSTPLDRVLRDFYAVPRDVRQRVLFDPSAEFVAGFSGGGENAYIFSRFWAQHVAGMLAMSGWMGNTLDQMPTNFNVTYYRTSQPLAGLLVARTTGTSDASTQLNFLTPDGDYLNSVGAVVADWTFTGGHAIPADSLKTTCLNWLVSSRVPPGPTDQSSAQAQADNWYTRAGSGQTEAVLREGVATLMKQPRSWFALQAQLVMDELMTNYNTFRALDVSNLGQGDFCSDHFFYAALGAATNQDWPRYLGNLKAFTGVTGTCGDRAGDIAYMLTKFGYPAPVLGLSANGSLPQAKLSLHKDVPGLAYSLESRTNLLTDAWQPLALPVTDTNTTWATTLDFDAASTSAFYRLAIAILPGTSPPWPNGSMGP